MNLGELRRTVHRRSGVDYEASALTDLVNEALQHIATEGDWPWLERAATLTLVPGQASYPMPTDWLRTRSITVNGDEHPFVSIRDIDTDPEVLGYSTSGDSFTVSPEPTTAHEVLMRYVANEKALVSDSDVPYLPSAFHGAVVAYAVAEAHRRKGNFRAADAYDENYDGWLRRIRKGIARSTGPRRIRVRPGGAL